VVRDLHQRDLAVLGRVVLPGALDRKFPNASLEWRCSILPRGEAERRAVRRANFVEGPANQLT